MTISIKNELFLPPASATTLKARISTLAADAVLGGRAESPFEQYFSQALGKLEKRSEMQAQDAPPLTKEEVSVLLLKMQRQMNNRLLRMLTDDTENDAASFSLHGSAVSGASVGQMEPSEIPLLLQRNDALPSPRQEMEQIIHEAAGAYGVEADLIRSVIKAESNFKINSTSPRGAQGLMQLMPGTARELGVVDPYDPRQNIMGGVRYLRRLLDRYHGDQSLALAAYNWGMGNVERHPERLPKETRAYIVRVTEYLRMAKV